MKKAGILTAIIAGVIFAFSAPGWSTEKGKKHEEEGHVADLVKDAKITIDQAIEYYTLGSAYAEFADERKGTLTEGKLADFVMLSRDLFSISPRQILDTRPVLTVVGGRIVYEAH